MSVALIVTRPFTALAISARRGEHLSVVFAYRFTTVSRCSRVATERAVAVIGAGRPGVEESLLWYHLLSLSQHRTSHCRR